MPFFLLKKSAMVGTGREGKMERYILGGIHGESQ
jgi:hypothetical protein